MKRIASALAVPLLWAATAQAQTSPEPPVEAATIHIKGLQLRVSDVQRSVRFYTEVLGLKVSRTFPDGPTGAAREVLLSIDGTFDLGATPFLAIKAAGAGTEEHRKQWPEFGHVVLMVTDTPAIARRARMAGYAVVKDEANLAMLVDPDGYNIEILRNPKQR